MVTIPKKPVGQFNYRSGDMLRDLDKRFKQLEPSYAIAALVDLLVVLESTNPGATADILRNVSLIAYDFVMESTVKPESVPQSLQAQEEILEDIQLLIQQAKSKETQDGR